jgi:hypothetical protein
MSVIKINAVKSIHRKFLRTHESAIDAAMTLVESFPQKHVRENPRGYKHRTGNLTQKTQAKFIRVGKGKRLLRVKNTAKYAAAQDGGSGLHGPRRSKYAIVPRRAKLLRFTTKSGAVVFARKVMHPGVKPTRFLYRATNATYRVLGPHLEDEMRRAAFRFGR